MSERSRPSLSWYRDLIQSMDGFEPHVGPSEPQPRPETKPFPVRNLAFGTFVRLERRQRRLSVAKLASDAKIDAEEVRRIEHDEQHIPKPRTIVSLAQYFKVPAKGLILLSRAGESKNEQFEDSALKFAAHSDDLGGLTPEEESTLQAFVNFLRESI